MIKLLTISLVAVSLAGCTVREQQVLTAGAAGVVVGSLLTQPTPVYVEERYIPIPPRRYGNCYKIWDRNYREHVVCR
jgi:hypothetical protein